MRAFVLKALSGFRFPVKVRDSILRQPLWAVALLFSGGLALWVVGAKSLPLVLAKTNLDFASQFAPEHPVVLLARAEKQRRRLVELVAAQQAEEKKSTKTSSKSGAGRYAAPEIAGQQLTGDVDRNALRAEIRQLATQVLEADPLNARAFRLLAEASDEEGAVRGAMKVAFQLSRRETTAAFWLLNDSFQRKDAAAVLNYADVVLRTKGQLAPLVMSYLGQLATDRENRGLLVAKLATNPLWRGTFFRHLPKSVPDPKIPLLILLDLKDSQRPVTDAELKPYLSMLLGQGRSELAYSAWLQHLPTSKLQDLGLLFNPSFDEAMNGLPFNWVITNRRYASVEADASSDNPDNRSLHLNLGPGRIKFGEVRQVLMLPPGTYRLAGSVKGALKGRRGVRWQLRCGKRLGDVLGQSELLLGDGPSWTQFSIDFAVPDGDSCRSQTLRLFHHARSASEQLIFGELWFDNLRLTKVAGLPEGADG